MNFIYPNNLKERKTFLGLTVVDLAITGALGVFCVNYAAENFSFIPLIFPVAFYLVKVRFLENKSNIWEQLIVVFNYLVNEQQEYNWGEKGN